MIKGKSELIPRAQIMTGDPTRTFTVDDVAILAADIRAEGLREPLLVRPRPDQGDGFVEVVFGERRLRACTHAGLEKIPCFVSNIGDEGVAAARAEYLAKRQRWVALYPAVRAAMLEKAARLKKLTPGLLQKLAAELGLPKKIKPAEFGPSLAANFIRDEVNAGAASYFAEERIAPWAKGLGVDIKAIERKEKAKRR